MSKRQTLSDQILEENWDAVMEHVENDKVYQVRYEVNGASHLAGPYSLDEAIAHKADIETFDGVTKVHIQIDSTTWTKSSK